MAVIWTNGNIYTMASEGEKVEAVLTEGGKIVAIGSLAELRAQFSQNINKEVDLFGATMLPGFVDSHMHLIGFGESQLRLNLSHMNSKEEVLTAIKKRAKELEEGEWLIGEGWNENAWNRGSMITKDEIDAIVPNNPVLLKRVCRHVTLVNSKALQVAGIHEQTPHPQGGVIERAEDGRLNGILKDSAQDLMTPCLPTYTIERLKRCLKKGIESCYKLGLTGAHTEDLNYYGSFHHTYEAFKQVIEDEQFRFRTHLLIHHEVIDEWNEAGYRYLSGSEFVEFGPMKIFVDGSLGGRTALLSFPYGDDPSTQGVNVHTYDELLALVKKARTMGIPIATHTIGDLAFEWVLDAIEKYPLQTMGHDRFIHTPLLRKELVDRAKRLPVVFDIQPRFLASDFPWVLDRIGDGPIDYVYAWKSLLNEGIRCAGGSDAPIEPADPLLGLHAAVTRTIPDDPDKIVYGEAEKLSMFEAVSLFTSGSAYAGLQGDRRGMIREGYDADFTILDKDIFHIDPDQLLDTKVLMTVVNGEMVYTSK